MPHGGPHGALERTDGPEQPAHESADANEAAANADAAPLLVDPCCLGLVAVAGQLLLLLLLRVRPSRSRAAGGPAAPGRHVRRL